MKPEESRFLPIVRAIVIGGAIAGILDAADAIVAFKLVLGFHPVPIYQFVASGVLGPSAFTGGIVTALLGLAIHFLIAFTAALVFVFASTRVPALTGAPMASGAAFGVAVWAVMNFVVIPLSRIPPAPFSFALFVNGVVGHAIFVGIPIAYAARHHVGAARRSVHGQLTRRAKGEDRRETVAKI